MSALEVRELRKSYGANEAVAGISFTVEQGEVFGLLGPNGAGKTTTVEILEGYRKRDSGAVAVLGVDPEHGGTALRERIGVVLQASELPPSLTVHEVHRMFAGYYAHPRDIDEVIGLVGLAEKADARVKTLSGGQKRRLDLGVALVGDPELVFLDEPTTGFDPSARRTAWELVRSLRALGKTILLTTHYLDEAQQLADRVAVIRDGRIVKQGSPAELIGLAPKVEIRYRENGRDVVIETDEPTRLLAELTGGAAAAGLELESLEVVRPSLEDVYLDLIDQSDAPAGLRILFHELRNQQRLFWRNRESAVFVFIFPPMLFLLLGALYSNKIEGFRAADVLLVGLIGYGCANTAFAGLAITTVIRRESGVLKRIRATPLPTVTYLTAVVGSTLAVFVLQMLVTIALGVALYGAKGPENRLGLIPVLLLGVGCFAGLGFGAAALIRSAEGASAVVNLIVLPMAFLSGSFGPTRRYPEVLQWLADVLPLTYLNDLLKQVYLEGDSFFGHPKEIAIVVAWGLVGLAIAWRRFGWEPRER